MHDVGGAWDLIRDADAVLLDVDGVVCVGDDPIDGAAEAVAALLGVASHLLFVTNDSRRDVDGQYARLRTVIPDGHAPFILTSTSAAIQRLQGDGHRCVRTWGHPALDAQLIAAGIAVAGHSPTAVVTGAAPLGWSSVDPPPPHVVDLLDDDVDWYATNADPVVPGPSGPIPDAGALIQRLRGLTGRDPVVCGKPHIPMRSLVGRHLDAGSRAVVIGDRQDSDVALARADGHMAILVGEPASGVPRPDVSIPTLGALTDRNPNFAGVIDA